MAKPPISHLGDMFHSFILAARLFRSPYLSQYIGEGIIRYIILAVRFWEDSEVVEILPTRILVMPIPLDYGFSSWIYRDKKP